MIANTAFPAVIVHFSWRALYPLLGGVVALVLAVSLVVLRNGPTASPGALARPGRFPAVARTLLTSRDFVLMSVTGLGGIWGAWGYSFWANPLMTKVSKIGPVATGGVVAVFGFCGLYGKPLYGLLSDLIGGVAKPSSYCALSSSPSLCWCSRNCTMSRVSG